MIVYRLIKYEGSEDWMKKTIGNSVHGYLELEDGNSVTACEISETDWNIEIRMDKYQRFEAFLTPKGTSV